MNPSPKDTGKPQFWTLRASSSYDNETDVFGEMLKPQDGDIRVCKLSEYELLERKLAKAVEQRNDLYEIAFSDVADADQIKNRIFMYDAELESVK
jgi:hypothetical protein